MLPGLSADDATTDGRADGPPRLLAAALALLVLLVCSAALVWRYQHHRDLAATRVEFVARLRASELESWLAERRSEARFIRTSTYMVDLYRRLQAGDEVSRARLLERLVEFRRDGAADAVAVLDAGGRNVVAEAPLATTPTLQAALQRALAEGTVQITDPQPGGDAAVPLYQVIPYVYSGQPAEIAAVLRIDARRALLERLAHWPLGEQRATTRLWRRGSGAFQALDAAGGAPRPAPGDDGLLARGLVQAGRAVDADDGGGQRVIAAVRPVAGSEWLVSAAMDRGEVLGALAQDAVWILSSGALALLAGAIGARALHQQRALAEAARQREQQRQQLQLLAMYAAIAEGTSDAILAKDRAGRYLLFNAGAERVLGVRAATVLGHDDRSFLPAERAAEIEAEDRAVIADGRLLQSEREQDGADGLRRYQITKGPLRDAAGNIVGVFAVLHDVTERRRLQREVEESLALRAQLLQQSADGVVVLDEQGGVVECNDSFARLIGRAPAAVAGLHIWDWDPQWPPERVRRAYGGPQPFGHSTLESRFRRDDGSEVDVEISVSQIEFGGHRLVMATCRDISERKRVAAELEQHRHHLEDLVAARSAELERALQARLEGLQFTQSIADAIPSLVACWGRDLRCRFANRAHELWHGVPIERIAGMHLRDFLGEEAFDFIAPRLREVLAGRPSQYERTLRRPDGVTIHALAHLVPDRHGDEVRGFFIVVADVSAVKQAELRLQQLNDELVRERDRAEAANQAKTAFLANMSHEIRTPMNAIVGLTHLLRREAAEPQQIGQLDKIDGAAQHLLAIINDILDLSKIEAGKLQLERADFSLDAVLSRVVALVADRARAKGVELVLDTDHLPDRLHGDATRLSQALLNLLNNAVKFTEQGSIVLRCELLQRDAAGLLARFEVRDSGVGIAAAQRERLFQAFEQADSSTTRRFGGTGLGLAITRRLAELMGGTVGVHSELGRGSSFWFTARLAPALEGAAGLAQFSGRRVLLADDLPEARAALTEMLGQMGLAVVAAADGEAAIDLWRIEGEPEPHYDLLLLDEAMPGLGGLDTLRRLRERTQRLLPPALLLAARDEPALDDAARAAGFAAVLVKPVTASSLQDVLARLLAQQRRAAVAPLTPQLALADVERRLRDEHPGARVLLAEDNLVNQEVALALLRAVGLQVDVVGDGTEALARVRAQRYDLVLLDVQMPGMDGLQAARAMRALPEGRALPILAMTANAFAEDREECLAAGMNDHVAKPVDTLQMYRTLLRWLPAPAGA